MNNFHSKSIEEAFKVLKTDIQGLSREEAELRLNQVGFNQLPEEKKLPPLFIFLKQFHSVLVYVLLGAVFISFLIGKLVDVYVILAVIIANAIIGFIHERRAENAIEALRKMIVLYAKVYRGGELLRIPISGLVPGDILSFEEGDKVPADARLIDSKSLRTDEAILTGESYPVDKDSKILPATIGLPDRKNMVWMGTSIVRGEAKAVVTATGIRTAIGQVAESIRKVKRQKTHFEVRSRELVIQMGLIALVGASVIFLIGFFLRKLSIFDIFLFSVASLVSGIPEGLPAVLTIVLAVGAHRMAKRNALIRRLPAVETLGVATVIATDKTGTLTQNSMTVRKIILPQEEEIEISGSGWEPQGSFFEKKNNLNPLKHFRLDKLLHIAAVCNNSRLIRTDHRFDIIGDPTEAALVVLAEKAGLQQEGLLAEERKIDELPFDESQKFRSALIAHEKHNEIYVVGAFEKVIALSDSFLAPDGKVKKLTSAIKDEILYDAEDMAKQAMRVLTVAYKEMPSDFKSLSLDDVERLTFVGAVGMIDPPRPEVKEAVARARKSGVRIVMKTGDHRETALAIAKEIGLVNPLVEPEYQILTEDDLEKMSPREFENAVSKISIFARLTPAMKLKIVGTLQQQGEIVAMTGDGVNDAPALKKADIGVSMGVMGTDVARESSEMVLADDNFASIVNAIEEGRIAFNNVRRTSFFLVTTNVAEHTTLISSLILGLPLPLLPIHILWLNLVTDGTSGAALAMEPSHHHELDIKPRSKEQILSKEIIPFLLINAVLMTGITVILFTNYLFEGIDKARTIAFTTMAFLQLFNVLNMRSLRRSVFKTGFFSNRFVLFGLAASIILQSIVIYTPFLQKAFHFVPPSLKEWGLIILVSSSVFWAGEIYKVIRSKFENRRMSLLRYRVK